MARRSHFRGSNQLRNHMYGSWILANFVSQQQDCFQDWRDGAGVFGSALWMDGSEPLKSAQANIDGCSVVLRDPGVGSTMVDVTPH